MKKKTGELSLRGTLAIAAGGLVVAALGLFVFSGGVGADGEALIGSLLLLSFLAGGIACWKWIALPGRILWGLFSAARLLCLFLFPTRVDCAVALIGVAFLLLYALWAGLRSFPRKDSKDLLTVVFASLYGVCFLITACAGPLKRICTTDASFAGWLLAVAAAAGVILGIFAVWRRSGQGMKARLKTGLITFCCSLALIWFLLSFGGSAANYAFDFSEGTAVELRITGKEIDVNRKGPTDYELRFGGISVAVPLDVYKKAEVGDSFLFYRYQGAFGLEYYEFTERK